MYEFWYNYVKPKYGEKAKLCYMDTDTFIVYIKTGDYQKEKNKNIIGFMKDEVVQKVKTRFVGLRAKT